MERELGRLAGEQRKQPGKHFSGNGARFLKLGAERPRVCAVSRRGSLHGESPSRSGGAAVTGTKLLSRAFHHNHPPPQPFSSGGELVRVPVCVQVHGHACGYQAVQHTPFPSASPTQWFQYRHSLGRAAHEILWKREASLKGLISMTWTTQHLRFPGRQSWGENYQGHEGQAEQRHEVGGIRAPGTKEKGNLALEGHSEGKDTHGEG